MGGKWGPVSQLVYLAPLLTTAIAWGGASGLVNLLSFVPYVGSVVQGKARPERASWFIFSVLYVELALAEYRHHAGASITVYVGEAIGCTTIAILSIRHGTGGFDVRHKRPRSRHGYQRVACWATAGVNWALLLTLAGVAVALVALLLVPNGSTWTIILAVSVDLTAAWLTAHKTYWEGDEPTLSWVLYAVSVLLAIPAVDASQGKVLYLYPVEGVVAAAVVLTAIGLHKLPPPARRAMLSISTATAILAGVIVTGWRVLSVHVHQPEPVPLITSHPVPHPRPAP
jgi:hypothetical protein